MSKITKFDGQNLKEIRTALNAALEAVRKNFDINIEVGRISYDSNNFSTRLKVATKASQASNLEIAERLGQQPIVVGTIFKYKTSTYTVDKIDLTKPKYKICATNQHGTTYWFPIDLVNKNRLS